MCDATSSCWLWLILIFIFFSRFSSADQKNITAESGHNVALTCGATNDNIKVVEWSRADLEPEYVFVWRNKKYDPDNQHPSFKDRVDLQDTQMKDGNVSVVLKNVTINDTGTYECRVKTKTNRRKRANLSGDPICIINLSVAPPPGPPGGLTEGGGKEDGGKEDGGKEDGGKEGGPVGLIVGVSVAAGLLLLLLGGVLIFIYKPWRKRHGLDQKQPDSLSLQPCKEKLLRNVAA